MLKSFSGQRDVPFMVSGSGRFDGLTNADVRAQVTGYLMKQAYQEGAFVSKGSAVSD